MNYKDWIKEGQNKKYFTKYNIEKMTGPRQCKDCGVEVGKGKSYCQPCKVIKRPWESDDYQRHCKDCGVKVGKGKSYCPKCKIKVARKKSNLRRDKNRDKVRAQARKRYKTNPEVAAKQKKWREDNPDRCKELGQKARQRKLDKLGPKLCQRCSNTEIGRKFRYCRPCWPIHVKEQKKIYNDKETEYRKKRREDNREAYNAYYVERRKKDVAFRLRCNVSTAVSGALNGKYKNKSTFEKLPYTVEQLKEHLEKQFDDEMNWDNYGRYPGWQIDHENPQSNLPFDSLDHPNFLKCWGLNNLQPMWAKENLEKSDKLVKKEFITLERFF